MTKKKDKKNISDLTVTDSLHIYNIINNINKFKVLLVFLNKGFTWQRELVSMGIFGKEVDFILNEFNNRGLIKLKGFTELEEIQFEALSKINQIKSYFKIYFITQKFYNLINENIELCLNFINENKYLIDFIEDVKNKLKPYKLIYDKILEEESTQLSRKVNLNGVTFEKETLMSKEVKKILKLTSTKKGTNLILNEIKPLALMTETEKKRHINKVYLNGNETNHNIFREIEEQDLETNNLFNENLTKNEFGNIIEAFVGKSSLNLDLEREKEKSIFDLLGVEE